MDFFAKSKNADQIRNEYTQRIEETQRKCRILIAELNLLRKNGLFLREKFCREIFHLYFCNRK